MDCKEWLKGYLEENGPVPYRTVMDAAWKLGYSKRELRNARAILDVISISETLWRLPK